MDANEALENARYASELDENEVYETVRTLAAEVRRLREMEARVRTTATRPQGYGERTADYRLRRQLGRHFLGEA